MDLHLQFGWGMMDLCRTLVREWGGGTVILSPRDLEPEQIPRFSQTLAKTPNASVWLDSQFYLPHSDHERLCRHAYWPQRYQTNVFFQGADVRRLLTALGALNTEIGASSFVLPGLFASNVTTEWLGTQRIILEEAGALGHPLPLIATVAVSGDAMRSADQVAALLEFAERHRAPAYYLVCEHPNGAYLVPDEAWLTNVLDLTAGLRLLGSKVILGYCNHQMLIGALAKANAICSGTWMNVRSFPPEKFRAANEEDEKRKSTWFYCPQALTEYKIPALDLAQRVGLLARLAPAEAGEFAAALFGGVQPTSVGFAEPEAFRHYLHVLRAQAETAGRPTFDDTVAAHNSLLDSAEELLRELRSAGVRGQQRDFADIIEVNRAALGAIGTLRGATLRRYWTQL
jgi:hypothetical protein